MQIDTIANESTPSIWTRFHEAVENLGEFADQVERSLAPTSKQQFIQTLAIADTHRLLSAVNDQITVNLEERVRLNAALYASRQQAEEARALVLLSGTIDGKNAEQREAQLLLALKDDPAYREARAQSEGIERQLAEIDVDLEGLRAQQSGLKIKARTIAAQLEYLAG